MELFDTAGHLTDTALRALVDETLDEMGRLEAAEHLSFCDACLVRYTALLDTAALRTPKQPLAPPVLHRIRQRAVRVFASKYVVYGAAACLALVLWGTGVFGALASPPQKTIETPERSPEKSFSLRADNFLRSLKDSADSSLAALALPAPHTATKE